MLAYEFAEDKPDMDFQNYKRNIKSHFQTCNIKTEENKRKNEKIKGIAF